MVARLALPPPRVTVSSIVAPELNVTVPVGDTVAEATGGAAD